MKESDLKKLKIRKDKIEVLKQMGIHCIEDLLMLQPIRYESNEITGLIENEQSVVKAIIIRAPKVFFSNGKSRLVFKVLVNEVEIDAIIFNQIYLSDQIKTGIEVIISGKYQRKQIVVKNLEFDIHKTSTIKAIYPLKDGIAQKTIQSYIERALPYLQDKVELPLSIIKKHHLCSKKEAIYYLHQPVSVEEVKKARRYLKYVEFFYFQVSMQLIKKRSEVQNGLIKTIDHQKIQDFIKQLPFKLTNDQNRTIEDILEDLKQPKTMYRFVQGDVGSGKTVVAIIAMLANYTAGYQSALMVPTEVLAKQHYQNIVNYFKGLNIQVALLVGSLNPKEKKATQELLQTGKIDIVIGTHALLYDHVQFLNLGLEVIDEQHRFGVEQRKTLKAKGNQVDFLVMSATPIPRTLALSLYGDMDVSTIQTVPTGRTGCITQVIKGTSMKPFLDHLKTYLGSGGQVYVVCPLVNVNDKFDFRDATTIYEGMAGYFENQYEVGLLHGQMDEKDKQAVMSKFKNNEIQILVATTVIEVGVDVGNANMMVIYNAERFGLSQLHQLRGRVGRSDQQGYCYLLSNSPDIERLQFLQNCTDGFEISKFDMELRGPGDVLGQRQSGMMKFKIGDVIKDATILEIARNDVVQLLKNKGKDEKFEEIIEKMTIQLKNNNAYID